MKKKELSKLKIKIRSPKKPDTTLAEQQKAMVDRVLKIVVESSDFANKKKIAEEVREEIALRRTVDLFKKTNRH